MISTHGFVSVAGIDASAGGGGLGGLGGFGFIQASSPRRLAGQIRRACKRLRTTCSLPASAPIRWGFSALNRSAGEIKRSLTGARVVKFSP